MRLYSQFDNLPARCRHLRHDSVRGGDGFCFDNLEIVEHGTKTSNGPCDDACSQGWLAVARRLREKHPRLLLAMQNAASDVTQLGKTGEVAFPGLLDGIAHEEVFAPRPDGEALRQLQRRRGTRLDPGGRPFWIGTEDYIGSCASVAAAKPA